ncbi:3-oxoacyl-ACP reductase [Ornithinicoccus hortensis]|uniref:3-oxoacyl-[acyl-carrier protein] reductase n=1 Tax=Ornithinicoccus hortensis TaxID=82346 RepID=A0A542YPF7_9MICO|nr:3-oxoacyl-ACP reductase [Ornithinicoccus hortensis]TQL49976.1 3-oxoacyl-[acyl-carrier protein] reductase [Ornithinicoccus hortensis]
MPNLFSTVTSNPVAKAVGKQLGLPQPVTLRRGRDLPTGDVVLGTAPVGAAGGIVADALAALGVPAVEALRDDPAARTTDDEGRARPPAYEQRIGAVVVDATAATTIADLEAVRALLRPALKGMGTCGRVVLVGTAPELTDATESAATQQALEGIVRSVGKELRAGATANLVWTAPGSTGADLASTLSFLLEGRSAYVSGQPWRVGTAPEGAAVPADSPFDGRVVVVTGAARGIGADIARVFARDGAKVVVVDIPASGEALGKVANEIGGTALQLDITATGAGDRIADHVTHRYGPDARIHAIVHNAGITRDKLLVNTDEDRWGSVLDVNLAAQFRINEVLLDKGRAGGLAEDGRVVGVASTSGVAGNRGQSNYAASKAGVIGLVRALAPQVADRGITVNAVAPGFIETEMTGKIPLATREFARRFNSLQQGGKPVDVAETIAYLAAPTSGAVNGQVIRVCGQSQIGA